MSAPSAEAPFAPFPLLDGPPVPQQVSREAVDWLVALQAPDASEATRAAWQHWCAAHADHARAWEHIAAFGAQLRGLPAPLALGALNQGASGRRRTALRLLCLAGITGSAAWWGRDAGRLAWLDWQADHHTATGERRQIVLADASRIDLDTASAIAVRFDAGLRHVRLLHGRMLVSTTVDAAGRPFVVDTEHGRLRALGTRFAVRQQEQQVQLAVFEGAVEIRPADASDALRTVSAGEQTVFHRTAVAAPQPVEAADGAWVAGMLVARDMALADFVAELARYRPGHLACDPAVAQLPVSGIYPLQDTDRVLDMLARTLPVVIEQRTRYWVTVRRDPHGR